MLEFVAEQASASGFDLLVYHIQETPSESAMEVREAIESIVQGVDPYLVYDIVIERWDDRSGESDSSKQERLLEAIFGSDRDVEYVVMGEIERGPIEEFTHSSVPKAVLNERTIPVTLVPIRGGPIHASICS